MATVTTQINQGSIFTPILSITLAVPWVIVTANGYQAAAQVFKPFTVAFG